MLEEQKVRPGVMKSDLGSNLEKPFSGSPAAVEPELKVDGITAQWSDESSHATLRDLSLTVKAGQLVAVVGPVGCGKVRKNFQITVFPFLSFFLYLSLNLFVFFLRLPCFKQYWENCLLKRAQLKWRERWGTQDKNHGYLLAPSVKTYFLECRLNNKSTSAS